MVGIIDYGMGNLYSVRNAFLSIGAKAEIVSEPEKLKRYSHVVLPGVGAFGDAMKILDKSAMAQAIKEYVQQGKMFMGICLGLQLLFETSQESPRSKGLGIIKGSVVRFRGAVKIPHIGWNQLDFKKRIALCKGIANGAFVYFCHSYYVKPNDRTVCVATSNYSGEFSAIVAQKNIYGIQFHPEKSQAIGLAILKNFTLLENGVF